MIQRKGKAERKRDWETEMEVSRRFGFFVLQES